MKKYHLVRRSGQSLKRLLIYYLIGITISMGIGAILLWSLGINPFEYYGRMLTIGMVGNNGSKFANKAINEADCLIVAGARVADRAVKQPDLITKDKTLIHIDIDPAEIGKNAGPNIPVVGDLKEVFEELNGFEEDFDFSTWSNRINSYKMTREGLKESTNLYVDPKEFVYLLTKELKEDKTENSH